jgi:hypothetical protein
VKQMLGAQRAHQRVLHQVFRHVSFAREGACIPAQCRNGRFHPLSETAHAASTKCCAAGDQDWPVHPSSHRSPARLLTSRKAIARKEQWVIADIPPPAAGLRCS